MSLERVYYAAPWQQRLTITMPNGFAEKFSLHRRAMSLRYRASIHNHEVCLDMKNHPVRCGGISWSCLYSEGHSELSDDRGCSDQDLRQRRKKEMGKKKKR